VNVTGFHLRRSICLLKKKKKMITSLGEPVRQVVDEKIGDAAELLHRQFLKHILGVRDSTANVIILAELGRFPLCFHWWQQILRYHNRINNLSDDECLIKCAFVEGMHDPAHLFGAIKFTVGSRVNL